jgi:hypothetical protein
MDNYFARRINVNLTLLLSYNCTLRTTSRKFLPALNLGTVTAGMLIFCLVAGLMPLRAERSEIQKLPNFFAFFQATFDNAN